MNLYNGVIIYIYDLSILLSCLRIVQRMAVGYYENERKGSVFTTNYHRKILKTCASKVFHLYSQGDIIFSNCIYLSK